MGVHSAHLGAVVHNANQAYSDAYDNRQNVSAHQSTHVAHQSVSAAQSYDGGNEQRD